MTDELKMLDELDSWIEATKADNQKCGHIFIMLPVIKADSLSKLAREAIELRKWKEEHSCISDSMVEAFNSGNGIYRP